MFLHDGFWQPMDTFKDKMAFDSMDARGDCPWMLWKLEGAAQRARARRLHAVEAPGPRHDAQA